MPNLVGPTVVYLYDNRFPRTFFKCADVQQSALGSLPFCASTARPLPGVGCGGGGGTARAIEVSRVPMCAVVACVPVVVFFL